jgi:hypothetical protein
MGIERVNFRERRPVMFYLHPWELDPAQPRPPMPWKSRMRHYVGIDHETSKLGRLLGRFRFGTARDVLQAQTAALPVAAHSLPAPLPSLPA